MGIDVTAFVLRVLLDVIVEGKRKERGKTLKKRWGIGYFMTSNPNKVT